MNEQPGSIWWQGCLGKFESRISFLARFCAFNQINLEQCRSYFGADLTVGQMDKHTLQKISRLLNEKPSTLTSVFTRDDRYHLHRFGRFSRYLHGSTGGGYCAECASHGYHSALHEAGWLARCPFHDSPLLQLPQSSRAINPSSLGKFKKFMASQSRAWPHVSFHGALPCKSPAVAALKQWWRSLSAVALPRYDTFVTLDGGSELQPAQALELLDALSSLPRSAQPLLPPLSRRWMFHNRRMPAVRLGELPRAATGPGLEATYGFFKQMVYRWDHPRRFARLHAAARKVFQVPQAGCQCKWLLERFGWNDAWARSDGVHWGYGPFRCPHLVALEQLDSIWGPRIKSRNEGMVLRELSSQALELEGAGLCVFVDGMPRPFDFFLDLDRPRPRFDWNYAAAMTKMFDAVAEAEIQTTARILRAWLVDIEAGMHPAAQPARAECVAVGFTATHVDVMRWMPVRERRSRFAVTT